MELKKTCSKCGEVKPIDAFHKRKEHSDGRNGICAMCASKYQREYQYKYKEKTIEKRRVSQNKYMASIPDFYVRCLISKSSGIQRSEIQTELIEAKQQQIKLKRLLKELSK